MYRKLFESLREYITPSIKAPIYVSCEVVMECVIPFVVAKLVNNIRDGSSFENLLLYGAILIIMAFLSLLFGILAGNALRAKDMSKSSFKSINEIYHSARQAQWELYERLKIDELDDEIKITIEDASSKQEGD